MKPLLVFLLTFSLFLLTGCSSSQPDTNTSLPILIQQQPLPAFPNTAAASQLRIPLELHISKTGTVTDAVLIRSSGDAAWDSAAITAIRSWRYTPAKVNGVPVPIWVQQTAVIRFSEPQLVPLAEIVCSDAGRADSAYQMLKQGAGFGETARRFSCAESRVQDGNLGTVNIQIYPEEVRNAMRGLAAGEFTAPIPYGDRYAIFYRLPD
ncbi:MAG: TonB family protein [Bacteroidetes bacterium]|nr:TonB family protein [Bacteroidota bacterium]